MTLGSAVRAVIAFWLLWVAFWLASISWVTEQPERIDRMLHHQPAPGSHDRGRTI